MKVESLIKNGSLFLPGAANKLASEVDTLFYFIVILSTLIFIGIIAVTIYFLKKYKRTEKNKVASEQLIHNNVMEITWTVIPFILVMIIFFWSYSDYLKLTIPREGALEIKVQGRQWDWFFQHPETGEMIQNKLVVPVNTAIKLTMISTDVLHSFYLPNFRIKRDLIPNRYTRLWFKSEKIGSFQIFCTEYCGNEHSNMLAVLEVLSEDDYQKWLKESKKEDTTTPLPILGKKLYEDKSCNTCHSIDGTNAGMIGPTWKGLFGKKREFTDGTSAIAEENYIRESIVNPKKKIVKDGSRSYPPVMNTYQGLLSDREFDAIIEFIKTLK